MRELVLPQELSNISFYYMININNDNLSHVTNDSATDMLKSYRKSRGHQRCKYTGLGFISLMEKYIKKIVVPGYIWEHWKDVDKCLYAIH